jgi:hypothetical protein
MKRNYLKPLTVALGVGMFVSGLSISLSSMGSANNAIDGKTFCYDSLEDKDCPVQTTATVTVTGSSSQTVGIQLAPGGAFTIQFNAFGVEASATVPRKGGKTVQTFTGTNGSTYTVTINMDFDYKIQCFERTSPQGQPCGVFDCGGHQIQIYTCDHPGGPGGTSTSN